MAYQVKCPICGERFYREEEEYVQEGRRYYHKKCYTAMKNSQDANSLIYKDKLYDVIKIIFNIKYPTPRILSQIKKFKSQGYSYLGMWKTLEYFFILNNNSVKKAYGGVGIIPHVYDEASSYFAKIKNSKEKNLGRKMVTEVREIVIKKPNKASIFDKRKVDISKL